MDSSPRTASVEPVLASELLPKLPAELRNQIYKLVISNERYLRTSNTVIMREALPPPITRVCRQIRSECLLMCFADKSFHFNVLDTNGDGDTAWWRPFEHGSDVDRIVDWLHLITQPCHSAIACIEIELDVDVCFPLELKAGPVLRRWERLAEALHERGYEGDRLRIRVHNMSPWSLENERVVRLFASSGLRVQISAW